MGQILTSNAGQEFEVISELENYNWKIKFEDGTILVKRKYDCLKGRVRNPNKPSYFNVGFEGIGEFSVYNGKIKTKAGICWVGMLRRCYDKNYQITHPSYKDCLVEKSWHNFQNFADWFYTQKASTINCEIDKDILFENNKLYSHRTCCLVPSELNKLFIRFTSSSGTQLMNNGKYRSSYRNNYKHISKVFDNLKDAQSFYNEGKLKLIKEIISKYYNFIDDRILIKFSEGEENGPLCNYCKD